jgi:DNA-binding transcriptional regulator YiaG
MHPQTKMDGEKIREDLDRVVESCRCKAKWNNADRKALHNIRKALGAPTKVAIALGVAVPTLHWWERQVDESKAEEQQRPPPEQQLLKLYRMLDLDVPATIGTEPKTPAVILKARTICEVLERAGYCDRTWTMRSGRPFVVLHDAKMLANMLESLRGGKTHAHFVYRAPKKGEDAECRFSQAKISFEALWKRISAGTVPLSILKRVHKVPIADENEANKLGLVDPWNSFCMCEYNEEGRAQFGRSVDVWQEVIIDTSPDSQIQNKRLVWLELPAEEAEKWRDSRIRLLEENIAGKNG